MDNVKKILRLGFGVILVFITAVYLSEAKYLSAACAAIACGFVLVDDKHPVFRYRWFIVFALCLFSISFF